MKITRMITDNGMKIMHVKYSKKEIADAVARAKKVREEMEKKRKAADEEAQPAVDPGAESEQD